MCHANGIPFQPGNSVISGCVPDITNDPYLWVGIKADPNGAFKVFRVNLGHRKDQCMTDYGAGEYGQPHQLPAAGSAGRR